MKLFDALGRVLRMKISDSCNSHYFLTNFHSKKINQIFVLLFLLLSFQQMSLAASCPGGSGVIGGNVFGDYNMNGLDDQVSAGVSDIEVYLYADNSQLVDTQITDAEGDYFFGGLTDGVQYRVEFVIPTSGGIYAGFSTSISPTSIQFVTAPSCDIHLGVSNPEDYCKAMPNVMTPCYSNGNPLAFGSTSADDAAVISFAYNATGGDSKNTVATAGEVGSLSGITINQEEGTVYVSAFLKRHVGLGPLGLGGLYEILDAETSNPVVNQFIDVTTLGIDIGSIPSNVDRGLPLNSALPSIDAEAFGKIGKVGIGGLDISTDNTKLWMVNLFDKKIYSLPINNLTAATVESFTLPNAGCNNGELRPFAVQYYRENVYVGAVCDASLGTSDDLEAIVYRLDGNTFTEVLRYDLNYDKGRALRSCVDETGWFPWSDSFPEDCTGNGDYVYPSPIFSSMAFDIDGSIIMGFMDRTGNQLGFLNYDLTGTLVDVKTTSGGDLLRADNNNGTYVLENNGTAGDITTAGADNGEGPGGGEFYYQDIFTNNLPPALYPHSETSQGAITIVPGTGFVLTTALDPLGTTVNSGGVNYYENTTGEGREPGFLLFSSGANGSASFGKANGLGAITVSCGIAPLEIGNYVWIDENEDGVQDPSELPLQGINLSLYDDADNLLVTLETDVNGEYLFNKSTLGGEEGLSENTNYTIVVGTGGQFNATTGLLNDSLALTIANAGVGVNSDQNDSDGVIATSGMFAGMPIVEVQTGRAGENNHSFEFGFRVEEVVANDPGTIEGHVFKDCENDGIRAEDDTLIEGVTVNLMGTDINGMQVSEMTITTANQHYAFNNVLPGTYTVQFETPAGYIFAPQDQGNDDTKDSDANPNTGETDSFVLTSGQSLDYIDAGFYDNEAPVLSDYPENTTTTCGEMPDMELITATDNCPIGVEVDYKETMDGDGCTLTIIREWTATDACGNSTVHTQTIEATDDTGPVITFTNPALIGLEDGDFLEVECNGDPAFSPGDVSVTDNCDDNPSITFQDFQIQQGDCTEDGYLYVLTCGWIATDACGNSTKLAVDVHIVDTTNPVFTDVPANITIECTDDIPSSEAPNVTDNCTNNAEILFYENQEGEGCEVVISRSWTAFDNCGNKAVALQQITIADNEPPVFVSTPDDVTISCGDDIPFFMPGTSDNCGTVEIDFEDISSTGTGICTNNSIDRIWTATDNCGNTSTHVQHIEINDTTAPTITFTNTDWYDGFVIEAECTNIPVLMPQDVIATDDCDDDVSIHLSNDAMSGTCPENGYYKMYNYTWTATDNCGNESTIMITLIITDNTPPVFDNTPMDLTVTCSDIPEPDGLSATDNCSFDVEVAFVETSGTEGCAGTSLTRTWTATDECGNYTEIVQLITVEDNIAPVFLEVPADQTLECNQIPEDAYPNVTDNCGGYVYISLETETVEGACAAESQLIRTWTATDVCGNVAIGTQTITIEDTTAPTFSVSTLPDMTVSCDVIPDLNSMTATDACSGQIVVTPEVLSNEGGSCENSSMLVIGWTATDDCGNATTITQNITISDNTPPVFDSAPTNVTIECAAIDAPPTVTATDNCSSNVDIVLSESQVDGTCENDYVIIRLWEATDACGNQSSYIQQVHVQDTTAPNLSAIPADTTVECDAIPNVPAVTATDNCSNGESLVLEMTEENTMGTCEDNTIITRTWIATDACGNVSSGVQQITVIDTTAPIFTDVPEELIILASGDAIPTVYELVATDNCENAVTIAFEETIDGNGCAQSIVRTWTATDNCGNAATFVQTISSNDAVNIVANVTDDTCEGSEGSISIQIVGGVAPYTYNWSNGQTTQDISNLVAGSYTVTVTDSNGCSRQKSLLLDAPDDCNECDINIGDFVWVDYDQDGIQDISEPGISGVAVNLIASGLDGEFNTADDLLIATDMTSASGEYLFECVDLGTYIIEFVPITLPVNTIFTNQNSGDNDELDSDANSITGQTDIFTVIEGQGDDLSFDAGVINGGCINVANGGEICCDQKVCGAGGIADTLYSVTPATGGFGTVEYLWMVSTTNAIFDANSSDWSIIPNATDVEYAPGAVFQTSFFTRCARSQGCENYVGETNVIVVEVVTALNSTISAQGSACINEAVTFVGQSSAGSTTYEWTFEGGTPATATTRNVNDITWDTAGVYEVTLVTNSPNCTEEITQTIIIEDCLGIFEFTAFQVAMVDETTIALDWEVLNQRSAGVYVVEYAVDGETFETIEVMNVVSNEENKYEFIHNKARVGYNEYRIKYVHLQSNLIAFSPEAEVLINPRHAEVRFFPNPFENSFQMEVLNPREDFGQLEIVDAYGKILQQFEVSKDVRRLDLDLSGYPQGVYFVKLKFGWYPPTTYKMLKTFE